MKHYQTLCKNDLLDLSTRVMQYTTKAPTFFETALENIICIYYFYTIILTNITFLCLKYKLDKENQI